MKIELVDRETGRPVDRVGEQIGPVSLVFWSTGFLVYWFTRLPAMIFLLTGAVSPSFD